MKKTYKLLLALVFAAIPLLQTNSVSAVADTCTWTGAVDTAWSTAGNWTCSTDGVAAPESGDALIFPESASNKAAVNDLVAFSFTSLQISGSGYTLTGTDLTLTATTPLTINQNAAIGLNITYAPSLNAFLRVSSGQTLTMNGTTAFSGIGGEVNVGTGGFSGTIDFVGSISGTAGSQLVAVNSATAIVRGAGNTFTASTVGAESNGTFECRSTTCFGDNANNIYSGGGIVAIYQTATFSNDWETSATTPDTSWLYGFDNITITGAGTVNDAVGISQQTAARSLQFTGLITNNSAISLFSVDTTAIVRVDTTVNGAGGFAFGGGSFRLSGASTYAGTNTVNSGAIVTVTHQTGLGNNTGATNVLSGGSLQFNITSPQSIDEEILLNGTGVSSSGALVNAGQDLNFTNTITLNGNTTVKTNQNSSYETAFSDLITGTGDLTFAKTTGSTSGHITIEGTAVNDYSGQTTVDGTTLRLAKQPGGFGIPGLLNVTANATTAANVYIANDGGNQIWDGSIVTLTNNGANAATFESSIDTEVVGTIVGDGHIESDGAGFGITVGGENSFGTFDGTLDNEGGTITKVGSDYWDLSGATFLGGGTPFNFVISGTGAILWGSSFSNHPVNVLSGAILKGTGSVGAVTVASGGAVNVGTSPGCMTMASLVLNSGSTYTEEIAGTTACTGYDQTTVTGTATLGNATFSPTASTTIADGSVLTIITAASVSGTFNGLPDGTLLTISGMQFRINYTATTVTLTKLSGTATSTGLTNTGSPVILQSILGFMLITAALAVARLPRKQTL